jgi:acetoin utilization protein AcuB
MKVTGHSSIRGFMSVVPHSIEPNQELEDARKIMGRFGIRHLPVLSGGRVVGLLAERDLTYIKTLPGISVGSLRVKDAMVYDPVIVSDQASLREVAEQMAEQQIGSVLICDAQQHLVGIFTYVDALKALGQLS